MADVYMNRKLCVSNKQMFSLGLWWIKLQLSLLAAIRQRTMTDHIPINISGGGHQGAVRRRRSLMSVPPRYNTRSRQWSAWTITAAIRHGWLFHIIDGLFAEKRPESGITRNPEFESAWGQVWWMVWLWSFAAEVLGTEQPPETDRYTDWPTR